MERLSPIFAIVAIATSKRNIREPSFWAALRISKETMDIADIYEAVRACGADTVMADAFRKAVGLPSVRKAETTTVPPRQSVYAGVDWARLAQQPYGVRM